MLLRNCVLLAGIGLALVTAGCSSKESFPVRTYPMGERVTLGHLIYTVFETQWLTHLGEQPNMRVPQNRYLLLRVSITNSGSGEIIAPAITLVDDAGQTYSEVPNGEGVPQWIGLLRQIKPAESAQGNLIFDVPPKHYKLSVTDETEQKTALVDIPLSFTGETPDLPEAPTTTAPLASPSGKP